MQEDDKIEYSESKLTQSQRHAKYGSRYFKEDRGYDKRVYENDFKNLVRIILTLVCFYIFQGCHWWGCFELGIAYSDYSMYYQFGIFGASFLVVCSMLISGRSTNKKKHLHEFYQEKIGEKRMAVEDEKARAEQRREHEAKMSKTKSAKDFLTNTAQWKDAEPKEEEAKGAERLDVEQEEEE